MTHDTMDWGLIRALVAVAETGSLTRAADHLGVSQPTVGRQLAALEEALGVPLVRRHSRGVTLTEAAAQLLPHAQQVAAHVEALRLAARGVREAPAGTVRVSATEPVALHLLPPLIARLRAAYPDVQLELDVDHRAADVLAGDADVAIRMFRPVQHDLIGRRVGIVRSGLYAAEAYIARHGAPQTLDALLDDGHTLIGFDRAHDFWRAFARVDPRLTPARFALRTDSMSAQLAATRQGLGVGIVQEGIAARLGGLIRVCPALALPELELWLVTAPALQHSAAVRVVLDTLASGLRAHLRPDDEADAAGRTADT